MDDLRLHSLNLHNFKGIADFSFEPDGQDVGVYAANYKGKSRLFNAWTWLLFGKDSDQRANYEIQTRDEDGRIVPNLDTEVEGLLNINGKSARLRKVFKEIRAKKRNTGKRELTGHTTDYFIDGVPLKMGEYDARVAAILDGDAFKILTDPCYFSEVLPRADRRELVVKICGDTSDEDVIASDKKLAELPKILQGRKLEDHRKVIKARRTEINKQLGTKEQAGEIPTRIDETQRGLPEVQDGTKVDEAKLQLTIAADLGRLNLQRKEKQEALARLEAGGEVAEQTKKLRQVEGELLQIKTRYQMEANKPILEAQKELYVKEAELAKADTEKRRIVEEIGGLNRDIERDEKKLQEFRDIWHQRNDTPFQFFQDESCPTCGHPIEPEKLQTARDKALADFNRNKAEGLENINIDGKFKAERIKKCKDRLEELQHQYSGLDISIDNLTAAIAKQQETVAAMNAGVLTDYTKLPEYLAKEVDIAQIKATIGNIQGDNMAALESIWDAIGDITSQITAVEGILARIQQREQGLKRIEELSKQQRALGAELEELERQLALTDEFVRSKVRLAEGNINKHFKLARFRMFEEQINGELDDRVCEVTYHGVPYGSLSHSEKINIGLDVINTLSEHYGFSAPIWVDNSEAVTDILPTRGQQIRLYVSASDPVLRVEKVELKEGITA